MACTDYHPESTTVLGYGIVIPPLRTEFLSYRDSAHTIDAEKCLLAMETGRAASVRSTKKRLNFRADTCMPRLRPTIYATDRRL